MYLAQQPERLKERYGHRLAEEFPPIDMGMQTIEQVLLRTIFHEGMHLQAILTIHRCFKRSNRPSLNWVCCSCFKRTTLT